MELVRDLAENVYLHRPENIAPETEIITKINFTLEDLTSEKGYSATPIDELFRKLIVKLNIPFNTAELRLTRRGDIFSSLPGPSDPLIFFAENGNELHYVESNKLKPYAEYSRQLSTGRIFFNQLDTGEATLEDVLKYVREKPVGEDLVVGLNNARMSLHIGYDFAASLTRSLVQHEREILDTKSNTINVQLNIPWLSNFEIPVVGKEYTDQTPEEVVKIFENLIGSHLAYTAQTVS